MSGAEGANGHEPGTDWLGRITGALWVGIPLLVLLQVADLLPALNGFSLVPVEAILALIFLIILVFRNRLRGRVSLLAEVGLGLALGALLIWWASLWFLSGFGH